MSDVQVSSKFLNMPLTISNQILKKLGFLERLTCRKVCRGLRTAVNKFEFNVGKITFNLFLDKVSMELEETDLEMLLNTDSKVVFNNHSRLDNIEYFIDYLKRSKFSSVKGISLRMFTFKDSCSILSNFDAHNLLRKSTFRKCVIHCKGYNQKEIAKVFKPEYDGGNEYAFEYSDNNNLFEIKCMSRQHFFNFFVEKKR
eukprot:NP_508361.1 F-box A protein [Caenorhabditis elegans]